MVNAKQLQKSLIFGILSIFWLGVFPGFLIQQYFSFAFKPHIIDILVVASAIGFYKKIFSILKHELIVYLIFTYIFALYFYGFSIISAMYLIRLISYLSLGLVIRDNFRKKNDRVLIYKSIIINIIVICVIGWLQYFFMPDLTQLKYFGWDDHLFRLSSTFLDPGFTGIILVIGLLILNKIQFNYKILIQLLIIVSVAFTYSRASFLAFIVGLMSMGMINKKLRQQAIIFIGILVVIILILPKPMGEGVKLARTSSIYNRFENYALSLKMINTNPLFGVGFNNICNVKQGLMNVGDQMNSCSGLDNSLLMIVATIGLVGLFILILVIINLVKIKENRSNWLLISSLSAVFIHSMFVNSLFYSWVMFLLAVILGLELRIKRNL